MFEVAETTRQALVKNLIELLDAYGLINKIIAYVKDEGSNLNTFFFVYFNCKIFLLILDILL